MSLAVFCLVSFAIGAQLVQVSFAQSGTSLSKMNFHMYSLVYGNSNSSIFAYNGADTNPPTYSTPVTTQVSCATKRATQSFFGPIDVWLGGVSWITQPLAQNLTVSGNFSMTVWMSTSDSVPGMSGYAFGIAEVDGTGTPIGQPLYQYHYASGSALTASPSAFTLVFEVERTFLKGNIIGFFAIVGSTTEGWRYQVYFDSPSMNSFAELPIGNVPIPEFSQSGVVISLIAAAVLSCVIARRKRQPITPRL